MIDLNLPTPDGEYVLYTDASNIGMSAILHQRQDDGEVPILCISKKLDIHQQKYSTVEKECLAIVWAINRLQSYLLGRHFVVKSDHKAFQWLYKNHVGTSRLGRWALSLQGHSFSVEHVKGLENTVTDYFSRHFKT